MLVFLFLGLCFIFKIESSFNNCSKYEALNLQQHKSFDNLRIKVIITIIFREEDYLWQNLNYQSYHMHMMH